MRRWTSALLFAAAAATAPAQPLRTLEGALEAAAPPRERVLVLHAAELAAPPPDAPNRDAVLALAWDTLDVQWLFWRWQDRAENRHPETVPAAEAGALRLEAGEAGPVVVGADFPQRTARLTAEQAAQVRQLAAPPGPAGTQHAAQPLAVIRLESATAIVRSDRDDSGPSPIATSKTGQGAEIRPLMDPSRVPVDSDLAIRAYVQGASAPAQRVLAVHLDSGRTTPIDTDDSGIGSFTIDASGAWLLYFHRLEDGEGERRPRLFTATLRFDAPREGAPAAPVRNERAEQEAK